MGNCEHRGDQACLCLSRALSPLLVALAFASAAAFAADAPHLGKPVSEADIKAWDISVLPDGSNLPPGSGTAAEGARLYVDKGCNQCHGDNGKGGPSNVLVGNPSLTVDGITSNKTIANFWAYPTTLFDYIRRAMPWPTPHTLTDNEVYAICAYLLRGQQSDSARPGDECADLAQGEDAEPRQLHHQVPGSDLTPSFRDAASPGRNRNHRRRIWIRTRRCAAPDDYSLNVSYVAG